MSNNSVPVAAVVRGAAEAEVEAGTPRASMRSTMPAKTWSNFVLIKRKGSAQPSSFEGCTEEAALRGETSPGTPA
eukprot:5696628-Alexandrium_andersonii.AAC.1